MFRVLGFRVHVQPGFVVFMLLIVMLYGDAFGLWLAGSLAVFTLLHELGHALAARANDAEAEISLGFLAGYAAYVPTRPLTRLQRAWISFAGPGAHLAASLAVLVALGVNPIDRSAVTGSDAALAIWWAGPFIGMLNLVPILPLDGGNIVLSGLDRVLPGRAQRVMLWFSIAVTVLAAVACFASPRYRGFAIVVGFLLVTQLQLLGRDRPATSPWADAAAALERGRQGRARRILVAALSHPQPGRVPPRVGLDPAQAQALVELLPDPLPHGDPANEYLLANVLISLGRHEQAAHYAAGSYDRHPNTLSAATIARAAGALGDDETAIGWLRTAAEAGTSPRGLAVVIDESPELEALRRHPDVVAIRRGLAPTV